VVVEGCGLRVLRVVVPADGGCGGGCGAGRLSFFRE
jgi:hypothetical protein